MTLFDDERYDWRETYFIYFESALRPKLTEIRRALHTQAPFLDILNTRSEPDGRLVAMTIASYEDHAALEIVYREGKEIVNETHNLVHSLTEEATPEELVKLRQIARYKSRFDIHHFEQTADTRVFNITKVPELKFSKQTTQAVERGDILAQALGEKEGGKGRFHFDSQSYAQCRSGNPDEELVITDDTSITDSSTTERIDPELLVTVLEILCRFSRGIALDPASGIIL